jgi:glycosyltransferase involved in cell wall biosynthesis
MRNRSIDIVIPVKNGGEILIKNIEKWLAQAVPDNWQFHIYLVDDGSTDGIAIKIKERYSTNKQVQVIRNSTSEGRAKARNQGADAGHSEFIAFFDADCTPSSPETISAFINDIEHHDTKLMFGSLRAASNDLWGKYFQDVADRRESLFLNGDKGALTTANCLVSRDLFYQAGKYDERYLKYGFEDKDLILRLLAIYDAPIYTKNAAVIHGDRLSLSEVCEKMYIAGRYTSKTFKQNHPFAYQTMSFQKADMQDKSAPIRLVMRKFGGERAIFLKVASIFIALPLPYIFRKILIKYCSGLFFAFGSANSEST